MSSRRNQKQANRSTRTVERRADPTAVGVLDVLSVGHGHMKVTITPGDQAEQDKARRMIEDMLKRGFSIFVEMDDGTTRRVKRFDAKKLIYYVDPPDSLEETAKESPPKKAAARRRYAEVPVARSKATAVGRMAGG